jgi:ABC-type lipoprotein release transport system permease subunit
VLYGVSALDAATFAGAGALLLAAALLAAWLPARRAAGADPAGLLRSE